MPDITPQSIVQQKQRQTASFMDPQSLLKHLDIKVGMQVADLGTGSGYITIPVARLVGENGIVYAVDVVKDKLEAVKSQAQLFGLPNVLTVWADLEIPGATKIPDQTCDITFLFNSLFQMKAKDAALAEARRITKKGGLIAVTEWANNKLGFGPSKDALVSDENIKKLAGELGLTLKEEHEVDDFHYLLEFVRP